MKNFKKIISLCLALMLCLSCVPAAFAAEVADATIDESRKGSLTIYKYDLTNAEKDGVWDSSYVSTGVMDQAGVVPVVKPIRGGTDGAQLSFMGLPCPNLFAGGINKKYSCRQQQEHYDKLQYIPAGKFLCQRF